MKVAIKDIQINGRHRRDMGNLQELADSMRDIGQLQPIGLANDYSLVWGERRIRAAKLLGWGTIEAVVEPSLDDARKAAKAERDENTCRKPFTVSEAAAVGQQIEEIEREAARKRKSQAAGEPQGRKVSSGKLPGENRGDSRDLAAAVVGMSGKTFEKAKKVAANATPELLAAVDANKVSVDAAAALVTLPKEKQTEVVKQGPAAVKATVATVRKEQEQARFKKRLEKEPERVAIEFWIKTMHDALVPTNSLITEFGSGKEWARQFSKSNLKKMMAEISLVIEAYQSWLADMEAVANES